LATANREKLPKSTTTAGTKDSGGFWDEPFSDKEGSWVIKGSGKNPRFACGDKVDETNGNKYDTVHQVWFRG
jgi:hypothetical protein